MKKSLKILFGLEEHLDTEEITPETRNATRKIAPANPFSTEASHKSGELLSFKCPSCSRGILIYLRDIDPIIGVQATCIYCKNVCHVPGGYKNEPNLTGLKITGGVKVPISKFADWFFEHPIINSLIESGQSNLLYDYGLWAFCASCDHEYHATVLIPFALTKGAPNISFSAHKPGSAKDMNALLSGRCSHCRHKKLIVIATEIPIYVRDAIAAVNKK